MAKRSRKVATGVEPVEVTVDVTMKLVELYQKKEQLAALTASVKKLEAELKKAADKAPNREVTTYMVFNGERIVIRAGFDTRVSNSVDDKKLIAEIGLQGYATIATVTQKAVVDNYGNNVLAKCLVSGNTESFSVKRLNTK